MLTILHTNDFHGALNDERQEKLAELRRSADFYFDCGDCVKAGNLTIPLKPDPVWPRLAALNCTASVPGNRESHPLEAPFKAKIKGLATPILCANLKRKENGKLVLKPNMILEGQGIKVGVFGVMVAMVTERMAARIASHFIWDDPIKSAQEQVEELRSKVDCLIALTHIGYKRDIELATKCPKIDIILGGHSHTVLQKAEIVGTTAICHAGSYGRFAGICIWNGRSNVNYELKQL